MHRFLKLCYIKNSLWLRLTKSTSEKNFLDSLYPKYALKVKWTTATEAIEYHETLAIEKSIQDNPQAREDCLNHQLSLEHNTQLLCEDADEELQADNEGM